MNQTKKDYKLQGNNVYFLLWSGPNEQTKVVFRPVRDRYPVDRGMTEFDNKQNPQWAVSGTCNRYQSNPSLHTSSPVLKSALHIHSRVSASSSSSSPPDLCLPAHFISFTHGREKESIAHRRRKHSAPLTES